MPTPRTASRWKVGHSKTGRLEDWKTAGELLERLTASPPGLIVAPRLLCNSDPSLPFSLGAALDMVIQVCDVPVLILPSGPHVETPLSRSVERVLVVTEHLTGDDRLVNWGVHFTPEHGTLVLAHVEDESIFERYLEVIGKLPGIDTQRIRERLRDKLLALPVQYVETAAASLREQNIRESVESEICMGAPLRHYRALLKQQPIELVICNGSDPGQEAMPGLAYALAIEVRDRPLLIL